MVRKRGFEPPPSEEDQPLKLARLPFRHFRTWGLLDRILIYRTEGILSSKNVRMSCGGRAK